MSRRITEQDTERPHYYSTYWLNIARQYGGKGGASTPSTFDDEDEEEDEIADFLPPTPLRAEVKVAPPELDFIPGGRAASPAKPASKAKPQEPNALKSLQGLASLSFGSDAEISDLEINADDDGADIISRLASDFDEEVPPDEEEAASLEVLEDEEWEEEEEDEDGLGPRRRTTPPRPVKPVKRLPPRRRPDF